MGAARRFPWHSPAALERELHASWKMVACNQRGRGAGALSPMPGARGWKPWKNVGYLDKRNAAGDPHASPAAGRVQGGYHPAAGFGASSPDKKNA